MNAASQEAAPLLEVAGLTVSFATERAFVPAVTDVSFKVGEGEIVSIVGESGAGKTVALLSILGLIDRNQRTSEDAVLDSVEHRVVVDASDR